jgi:2',3'-cyclic-nucleotide 2'-phosphodiesterase (5'-nucleotidase family)
MKFTKALFQCLVLSVAERTHSVDAFAFSPLGNSPSTSATATTTKASPAFLPRRPAGGRAPRKPDKVDDYEKSCSGATKTITTTSSSTTNKRKWEASPSEQSEARLIVLQITDVYTLEYFAHFKTLLEETKAKADGAEVVCVLTGDFLSPYLLSCVDHGNGMMNALAQVPMDYITWGNHEADIDHRTVCRHVRNFPGKWINSNMIDHEAMDCQQEYDVVDIASPDGSNKRKVGLCAVLSDNPDLYSQFEEPGAFGGATITDPWAALRKYQAILQDDEHKCDLVLPLQHTYVHDDHKTCREFDFPVILSGHDHHKVDEVVEGTRLIKPGMNGVHATVLEMSWPDSNSEEPQITSRFVVTEDWEADPILAEECERAYDALIPLQNTELAQVPSTFEPLSSGDSRGSVCTVGKYICTQIRESMNVSRRQRRHIVDAVLLMGGNIRGNTEYPEGSFFSLEALEAEVKSNEVVAVVAMPGWLLAKGIEETHAGDPIPGWMQYDEGIQEDYSGNKPVVTHVAGEPIDPDRIYRVATKVGDITNGQSPSWTDYYTTNSYLIPPEGAYVNIHAELMAHFARNLWRRLWLAISRELEDEKYNLDGDCIPEDRLNILDSTGNGVITVDDIQVALRDLLGFSVDEDETALANFILSFADRSGDGRVTKKDFEIFCEELSSETNKIDNLALASSHMTLEADTAQAILEDAREKRVSSTSSEVQSVSPFQRFFANRRLKFAPASFLFSLVVDPVRMAVAEYLDF